MKIFSWILIIGFCVLLFPLQALSQQSTAKDSIGTTKSKDKNPDLAKIIFDEVLDKHEFLLAEIDGKSIAIPLPVIIYSPQRGFSAFMSSRLQHGNIYRRYKLIENKIFAVNEEGVIDNAVRVYDFSLTRNVVQMILSAALLFLIMMQVAKRYKDIGSKSAPKGFQNAIETVIQFVRDEVAKSNLGDRYEKYMPFLLAVFFFILINNLFGLIPLSAKVTGNIAVTFVLAFISLIVILVSTNRNYWSHLFWPPDVPFLIKLILIPVEFAGIFIRPTALMIRLFANMVAGHIIIICFISLIFVFAAINKIAGLGFLPVAIAFTIFIYLLEILIAFIQAFIFTNLTAIFIGQSFANHHDKKGVVTSKKEVF